ncbi:hypothetical protein DYB31_009582 [Aphanomyces astaci]|uniref:Ion transport domain-containing protein n=1 Tax=Aphanomyces astaci TaxID=112090 RepID=A0A397F8H1_APHAT|nr:hypothetical protein DYB31_009582 [Aphanomyces astaci]
MATRRPHKANSRDTNVRSPESSMPVMEDHWSDVPTSYAPAQQVPTQNLREIESYYAQGQATTPSNPYYGGNAPLSSGPGSQPQGGFSQPFPSSANTANIHVIDKELQKQFRGRTQRSANSKIHWMENKKSQIMGLCWTLGCLGMTLAFYNYRWAGLIAGSINTIVCGMAVVVTYNLKREWHQHPNPIVHMRSCLSIFLAICLLLNILVDYNPANDKSAKSCQKLAGLTEFFFFSSEAWGLMMAIDLYSSVATQRRLFALKPKPAPSNKQLRGVRKRVFNVVVHPIFQGTKRVLILASVIVLAMDHYPSTPRFDSAYTQVLWFFTGVNVAEAALVLYAHGLKTYVRQNWVDAIAVVVSVMDSFPHLRVLRILRLNSHSMVSILKTLTMSLPALLNVASLLLLFAFVYAILGMNLFYDPDNPLYGECIRDVVNFDSLTSTMMVLFVVVTVL